MISASESLGIKYDNFFASFDVQSLVICNAFRHLNALYKGRDVEKVFQITSTAGTVKIEVTTSVTYLCTIAENLDIDDFSFVFIYKDLVSLLSDGSLKINVQITPMTVTFTTDFITTSLYTCNSVISNLVTEIINITPINLLSTIEGFRRLIKLNVLYKDFPMNKSIFCKDDYSYVITPVTYAYSVGCALDTVIDITTATFLVTLVDTIKDGKDALYGKNNETCYLKINNIELYIPTSLLVPEVGRNKLLSKTKHLGEVNATTLKEVISKLNGKHSLKMFFNKNELALSVDNFDFSYKSSIGAKSDYQTTIIVDSSYFNVLLGLCSGIIELREGVNLLVLKSKNSLVFLSCIN